MICLTNARIVLLDRVIHGTIVMEGGRIASVETGLSQLSTAIDVDGDTVIAGVVDLHTDNLERQVQPRSNARWPSRSAMVAHDSQCAAAGVTTVLDALCLGDLGFDKDRIRTFREGVIDGDALAESGLLKSDHYLHLRCEMPAADVIALLDPVADHPRVRMISLMDHSPGVGQYANMERYRALRAKEGIDSATVERRIVELQDQRARLRDPNRRALLDRVRHSGTVLASHDDRTAEEVDENHRDGIRISEFPVTMEAAKAARAHDMQVIAGAPNIVRGGSHSGNVAASDLVRARAVDAFASDYVPASLVEAAFGCVRDTDITLPDAVALVTDSPARMAGLGDRGRIATGYRADLVRIRVHDGLPIVRQVWLAGERVI
ncbi:alpha-D-ribose 1-methylphosphonate 5-triphosphate diphosphatase [Acidisphaera sp. L21]|jgi:alpha-D-ribose 1-methylphosphonate 5-triphosphate diphosphatase|uniref:alpha-D-ribose 1-methylphosphonate 5-triphosphate diphosphatase n=1 Tax=Acidisphaera sp. L21 TaxID=1641851 RepID=UPI00131DB656|nr:alpha-D-ribose 1-methylphosphonate 5-triphosphate diphosphatase [Acidisphaera sp. L21]